MTEKEVKEKILENCIDYIEDLWYKITGKIQRFFQRVIRGWDDSDTWDLDYIIAKFTLPRLKRFRDIMADPEYVFGIPIFSGQPHYDKDKKKWIKILDDMIYAFECICDEDFDDPYTFDKKSGIDKNGKIYGIHCDKEKQEKREKRITEGLELFGKYFRSLWS